MRTIAGIAAVAGLFALAPSAQGRTAANLNLYVNFFPNGTISVTLADGTPVGSTSGTPTVIPAGFYSLVYSGPGGCSSLPVFHLTGPGTNVVANMLEGEATKATANANFLPTSTYTWSDDAFPSVVHSFSTSADVVGTPPAQSTTAPSAASAGVTSQDVVGSAIIPTRGKLAGALSAAGRLTLAFKGKSVGSLQAGRYTITVSDQSSSAGFALQKLRHTPVRVTGIGFIGSRSASVDLTPGTWVFAPSPGKRAYLVTVH